MLSLLSMQIKSNQIKFWLSLQELIENDPENHIEKLIRHAEKENS